MAVALLISGAASLPNEVAWNRSWVLVFGSSLASTSTVLAAYLLGLGLGGRYATAVSGKLGCTGRALYRRLELALACLHRQADGTLVWGRGRLTASTSGEGSSDPPPR